LHGVVLSLRGGERDWNIALHRVFVHWTCLRDVVKLDIAADSLQRVESLINLLFVIHYSVRIVRQFVA